MSSCVRRLLLLSSPPLLRCRRTSRSSRAVMTHLYCPCGVSHARRAASTAAYTRTRTIAQDDTATAAEARSFAYAAVCCTDCFADEAELLDVLHACRRYTHISTIATTTRTVTPFSSSLSTPQHNALTVTAAAAAAASSWRVSHACATVPPLLQRSLHTLQPHVTAALYNKAVTQLLHTLLTRVQQQQQQQQQQRKQSTATLSACDVALSSCHADALLRMLERLTRASSLSAHATRRRQRGDSSDDRRSATAAAQTSTAAMLCRDVLCASLCAALAQRAVELTASQALHMLWLVCAHHTCSCSYYNNSSNNDDKEQQQQQQSSAYTSATAAAVAARAAQMRHAIEVCYVVRHDMTRRDGVRCLQLLRRHLPTSSSSLLHTSTLTRALLQYVLLRVQLCVSHDTRATRSRDSDGDADNGDGVGSTAALLHAVCTTLLLSWHALDDNVRRATLQWLLQQRQHTVNVQAALPKGVWYRLAQLQRACTSSSSRRASTTRTTSVLCGCAAADVLEHTRGLAVAAYDKATLLRCHRRGSDDKANNSCTLQQQHSDGCTHDAYMTRTGDGGASRVQRRGCRDTHDALHFARAIRKLHAHITQQQRQRQQDSSLLSSCTLQDVCALYSALRTRELRAVLACDVMTLLLRMLPAAAAAATSATTTTQRTQQQQHDDDGNGSDALVHTALTLFLRLLPHCTSCLDAVVDELVLCVTRLQRDDTVATRRARAAVTTTTTKRSSTTTAHDLLQQCLLHAYCRHVPRQALVYVVSHVSCVHGACAYAPHAAVYRLLLTLITRAYDDDVAADNDENDNVLSTRATRSTARMRLRVQREVARLLTCTAAPSLQSSRDAAHARTLQKTLVQHLAHQQQPQQHCCCQPRHDVRWLRSVCHVVASVRAEVHALRTLARLQHSTLHLSPLRVRLVARSEAQTTHSDMDM